MNLSVRGGMKYQKMLRLVVVNTEFVKCVLSRLRGFESTAALKNVGLRQEKMVRTKLTLFFIKISNTLLTHLF